jgi:glycosyltransferase involved in cell wall biosynthesis
LRGNLSQSELSDRFAESDVFAFPTRSREPFGFAPLEAAARGCVPLISQTCGLAEWFVHGVHLLKARRSPQDFANQFAAILDGSIDLSPMSGRTAEIIAHEYTIESIAPRIVEVLTQEAIRPRSRAGSAAEAYQLAVLAERLSSVLIQETLCA